MDLTSYLNELSLYANEIDIGRKGVATDGEEHVGRISYERGISDTFASFLQAQITADPQTLIAAELTFLRQELRLCNELDTDAKSSLTQAIASFEDALRCLEAVEDASIYIGADKAYPRSPQYRIQGYPRDAFHIACIAHRTRLHNILRAPGINMIEKAVLKQRAANMTTAQNSYLEKQKRAL